MQIIKCQEKDFDCLIELENSCFEKEECWSEKVLKDDLKSSTYLAVEENGELVAFLSYRLVIDEAELLQVCCKNNFRCSGLASKLMETMIDNLKLQNCNSIFLEVESENESAKKLYEKFGFKNIYLRKNYYGDKTALIYKLELNT